MRSKVLRITKLLALVVIALAMVTVVGCKKKTADKTATPPETGKVEQTVCPVMAGNPIDKNIFVEYKGKRVYFCCADCKAKFEANPEKYLDKLPQFKDELESAKKQAEQTTDKATEDMEKAAEKVPVVE